MVTPEPALHHHRALLPESHQLGTLVHPFWFYRVVLQWVVLQWVDGWARHSAFGIRLGERKSCHRDRQPLNGSRSGRLKCIVRTTCA